MFVVMARVVVVGVSELRSEAEGGRCRDSWSDFDIANLEKNQY